MGLFVPALVTLLELIGGRTMETLDDPTIAQVREVRRAISEECGHDADRLVEYYLHLQARFEQRLIDIPSPSPTDQDANRLGQEAA